MPVDVVDRRLIAIDVIRSQNLSGSLRHVAPLSIGQSLIETLNGGFRVGGADLRSARDRCPKGFLLVHRPFKRKVDFAASAQAVVRLVCDGANLPNSLVRPANRLICLRCEPLGEVITALLKERLRIPFVAAECLNGFSPAILAGLPPSIQARPQSRILLSCQPLHAQHVWVLGLLRRGQSKVVVGFDPLRKLCGPLLAPGKAL